jgi:hypothetical protein
MKVIIGGAPDSDASRPVNLVNGLLNNE